MHAVDQKKKWFAGKIEAYSAYVLYKKKINFLRRLKLCDLRS